MKQHVDCNAHGAISNGERESILSFPCKFNDAKNRSSIIYYYVMYKCAFPIGSYVKQKLCNIMGLLFNSWLHTKYHALSTYSSMYNHCFNKKEMDTYLNAR
uniref:Uncharacterized protein n=1 Tax=Cacopsylla melanoneura TaxID=428564 RepID=A0A8D8QIG4_9HEMI